MAKFKTCIHQMRREREREGDCVSRTRQGQRPAVRPQHPAPERMTPAPDPPHDRLLSIIFMAPGWVLGSNFSLGPWNVHPLPGSALNELRPPRPCSPRFRVGRSRELIQSGLFIL